MQSSAPYERMRSTLAGDETLGTKMRAGYERRLAAYATAAPWFPPDAATTPGGGTSRRSRFAKAPRDLKEPATCRCSSFSVNGNEDRPKSLPSNWSIGVLRTC